MRLHTIINQLTLELSKFKCINCSLRTICDDMSDERKLCSLLNEAEKVVNIGSGDKVKIVNILEFMLENDMDFHDLDTYYHVKKEDVLLLSEAESEIKYVKRLYDGQFYSMKFGDKLIDVHESLIFTIIEHGDDVFPNF